MITEFANALHATQHRIALATGTKRLPDRECAKLQVMLAAAQVYHSPVDVTKQSSERLFAAEQLLCFEWLLKISPPRLAKEASVESWAKDIFFMRNNGADWKVNEWASNASKIVLESGIDRQRKK